MLRKPFKDHCGGFHCFHFNLQVDIQALVHAAGLTRQDAVDSLRFAKGDLFQAFQVFTCFHTCCILIGSEFICDCLLSLTTRGILCSVVCNYMFHWISSIAW